MTLEAADGFSAVLALPATGPRRAGRVVGFGITNDAAPAAQKTPVWAGYRRRQTGGDGGPAGSADEDGRRSGNDVLTVVAAPGVTGKVVTVALTHYSLTGFYDDVIAAPKLRDAAPAPSFAAAFGFAVGP
jgi:hypothetical protein